MHMHSFQHFHDLHVFERSVATIEQHATMTLVLALVIILGGGYALNNHSIRMELLQSSDASEAGIRLSRFADPQYAHESAAREQIMRTALEGLRNDLQADRAYIAVYGGMSDGIWIEYQVMNIIEVTKSGIAPSLQRLQGLGRSNWLQMEDNASRASWPFGQNLPKTYGMELYDEQGTPVGYLGIEKIQANAFAEQDLQVFRRTAEVLAGTLAKPLEQAKDSI